MNVETQHDAPRLLTSREVCGILRVHRDTLRRWHLSGRLNALKVGPGAIRYQADDVSLMLRACEGRAASKPGPKPKTRSVAQ